MGCDGSVVKNLKQIKEAVLGLFIICVCSFQEDNCDNREIERISYLIILNIYAIKKKKKMDLKAIAKTSCEDFREIKSESRNDQPELIFKMVGL